MQFRVIVVTDPQTHTQTHAARLPQTGPITIHCTAKLSTQCNKTCLSLLQETAWSIRLHGNVLNSLYLVKFSARFCFAEKNSTYHN